MFYSVLEKSIICNTKNTKTSVDNYRSSGKLARIWKSKSYSYNKSQFLVTDPNSKYSGNIVKTIESQYLHISVIATSAARIL